MLYSSPPSQRNTAQHFNEILFSANMGFAIAYALYAYEGCSRTAVNAPESIRKLLEAFVQILRRIAPASVHMRTHSQLMTSAVIYEITFIVALSAISLGFYALTSSLRQSERAQIYFVTISGLAALAAVPICWLFIVRATWFDYEGRTFWETYGYLSALEIVVAGTLLYLLRNRAAWFGILVLIFHYCFWVIAIGKRDHGNFVAPILVSLPLSLVFPGSCLAWLRYLRTTRHREQANPQVT